MYRQLWDANDLVSPANENVRRKSGCSKRNDCQEQAQSSKGKFRSPETRVSTALGFTLTKAHSRLALRKLVTG